MVSLRILDEPPAGVQISPRARHLRSVDGVCLPRPIMPDAVQDQPGQRFPERIGRYELLLGIGTGGMGAVYLGRFEVVSGVFREVAVKLMHPQFQAEERFADELLQEARLAAQIRHPNVVRVLEAGQEPQGVYLVMDYVEGDTLAAVIRGSIKAPKPVPLPIAGRILHDTLAGLHAAHELRDEQGQRLQVVHRDVSPPNVLVGLNGVSRLSDFGIAKSVRQLSATATGVVKGKVSYMAPEQALGKPLDARCDVWAAGVVAWEMMAGKRLFRESSDAATLLAVVSPEPPPRLSSERPDVGSALDDLIAAALQPDLERRIGDAAEFSRRLAAALEPHGGLAEPEDVGRFVEQLVHKRLAKRREQAAEVIALRDQLGHVARSAAGAIRRDGLDGAGWESGEASDDPGSVPTAPTPASERARGAEAEPAPTAPTRRAPPSSLEDASDHDEGTTEVLVAPADVSMSEGSSALRTNRWHVLVALVGAMLAVGAAVGWVVLGGDDHPAPASEQPAEPAARTPAAPSREPLAQAPSSATAAATADRSRARLQVRANAPLAQVRVGRRPPTVLAVPSRQVELVLHDDDRAERLTLTAVARDGRRVVVQIEPDQHEVELAFSGVPRQPRPQSTPGIDGPGLVR